jgi:glucosamine-phosphate N-acetyltransferase
MNEFQYDSLLSICQSNKENLEQIKHQYISLLSQLTSSPTISTEEFIHTILDISNMGDIVVCYFYKEGEQTPTICGSGTVFYEPKLIHGCKKVAHIEDIVVCSQYRSHGIASKILQELCDKAKQHDCYKIILDCKTELVYFYEKNGFQNHGIQMSQYF